MFFSCRKASKGRPLHGAASASTGGSVGPEAVGGTGGVDEASATELDVGATVVSGRVVGASEKSSTSAKVSPRETGGIQVC